MVVEVVGGLVDSVEAFKMRAVKIPGPTSLGRGMAGIGLGRTARAQTSQPAKLLTS